MVILETQESEKISQYLQRNPHAIQSYFTHLPSGIIYGGANKLKMLIYTHTYNNKRTGSDTCRTESLKTFKLLQKAFKKKVGKTGNTFL